MEVGITIAIVLGIVGTICSFVFYYYVFRAITNTVTTVAGLLSNRHTCHLGEPFMSSQDAEAFRFVKYVNNDVNDIDWELRGGRANKHLRLVR